MERSSRESNTQDICIQALLSTIQKHQSYAQSIILPTGILQQPAGFPKTYSQCQVGAVKLEWQAEVVDPLRVFNIALFL